jgi:tetratricopeptide (TPR) repeat protein
MKYLIVLFILIGITIDSSAQIKIYTDSTLKFNQRFTNCEKKWVVISKNDTASHYIFGFIYVDEMAGFTFDLKGEFSVDRYGKYIVDTSMLKGSSMKYRISPNWRNVALVSPKHFNELQIQPQPSWVKYYYSGISDTSVFYNYRMGFVHNAAEDCAVALTYLKKAYKVNPHYKGLEFEMAYAYNDLKHPDSAEMILESALKYDPGNVMFYRELGYANLEKGNNDKAIAYYKKGIELCGDKQLESKSEMAVNMAKAYKNERNDDEYKKAMIEAKAYAQPGSDVYKFVVSRGF